MKKSVQNSLLIGSLAVSSLISVPAAYAGKPERDKADEVKPKVENVATSLKTTCGCEIHLAVKWDSFANVSDMVNIESTLDSIQSATKAHCEKEADKKAICENVTDFEVSYEASQSSVKAESKKIVATTGPSSYTTESMLTEVLDKY